MSIDYRRKVLKPLILKRMPIWIEDEQRDILKKGIESIDSGEMTFMIGHGFIVLGKSPKSQKKIRLAK